MDSGLTPLNTFPPYCPRLSPPTRNDLRLNDELSTGKQRDIHAPGALGVPSRLKTDAG